MTSQIADFIQKTLFPQGVAVIVKGAYMCAIMRGVKKENTKMNTTRMLGRFKEDERLRSEFIAHVYNRMLR